MAHTKARRIRLCFPIIGRSLACEVTALKSVVKMSVCGIFSIAFRDGELGLLISNQRTWRTRGGTRVISVVSKCNRASKSRLRPSSSMRRASGSRPARITHAACFWRFESHPPSPIPLGRVVLKPNSLPLAEGKASLPSKHSRAVTLKSQVRLWPWLPIRKNTIYV